MTNWQWRIFQMSDPQQLLHEANRYLKQHDLHSAATALDRAYGLQPENPEITQPRQTVLDQLAREYHGMIFRYVPGGYFLMGSRTGDPDERPVHAVKVGAFWISQTPVDWVWLSRELDYEPPPMGMPKKVDFAEHFVWEIRHQYCEDATERASDWHNHFYDAIGEDNWPGQPHREPIEHTYSAKPVVAVHWEEACLFCKASNTRLPSEAEWEKAARGGLEQQAYPWGQTPPAEDNCDFGRFDQFSILPSKRFAPNGYGLHAMCGGVWEWTSSPYDALAYRGKPSSAATQQVVRGGSWADCAQAVTVSFRSSRPKEGPPNPNQGFRVCLRAKAPWRLPWG